ncbi:MAG: 23S rRNA (adenine(2503)-C(2))-methyltransferase RlmN [Clostridiales bacterium]|jgi:23S rRNA (adenine2503-C2)-methyltransferase|nr:23S rRNA (adenine(2503)-C(2))-methyltransferase RlmN [Clostridiales bacterium]
MDILSLSEDEIFEFLKPQPRFRAGQIFSWLHKSGVSGFSEMTNVPAKLREELSKTLPFPDFSARRRLEAPDGAVKYLFSAAGDFIETVVIPQSYGATVCVSSQVGCGMGCAFCASKEGGFIRDLSAGEMCAQFYEAERGFGRRISRVVVMGGGEPFLNYENTVKFINLINAAAGRNIGSRNITVSTCGILDKIISFAKDAPQVNLSVSLHGADDKTRAALMPVAKSYSVADLMAACDIYAAKTRRRVTYEYTLIDGANSSPEHARSLAALMRGRLAHVNLIRLNGGAGGFRPAENAAGFLSILAKAGVAATIRKSRGGAVHAACGQLRAGKAGSAI